MAELSETESGEGERLRLGEEGERLRGFGLKFEPFSRAAWLRDGGVRAPDRESLSIVSRSLVRTFEAKNGEGWDGCMLEASPPILAAG